MRRLKLSAALAALAIFGLASAYFLVRGHQAQRYYDVGKSCSFAVLESGVTVSDGYCAVYHGQVATTWINRARRGGTASQGAKIALSDIASVQGLDTNVAISRSASWVQRGWDVNVQVFAAPGAAPKITALYHPCNCPVATSVSLTLSAPAMEQRQATWYLFLSFGLLVVVTVSLLFHGR